jgi:hypothetical protein
MSSQIEPKYTEKEISFETPIEFKYYRTYGTFQNISNFEKFKILYGKIKDKVNGVQNAKVIMQSYDDIKSIAKVMCIDVKSVHKHYDYLLMKLYNLLKKVNKLIVYAGKKYANKKNREESKITKAGNIFLCNAFKNIRKEQPQCISTNYIVPSRFSFKTTVFNKTFEGVTNSLYINNEIYKEVLNCFYTLQNLMNEVIIISIGGSYLNFVSIKNIVKDFYKTEFKVEVEGYLQSSYSSSSANYDRQRRAMGFFGGSSKKTKKIVQFKSKTKLDTKSNIKLKTKKKLKLKMNSKFNKKQNSS